MQRDGLRFGPLGDGAVHLCVDMQRLFAERTVWHTPGMARVLPQVERIVRTQAARTVFTRFVPARSAAAATGAWRRYYRHWHAVTGDELAPDMLSLMPPLGAFVPPAMVLDKTTYAPWQDGALDAVLERHGADTLVVTGGETDVCILGAVLGAVDRGHRVVLVEDAVCSGSEASHDAMMAIYRTRYDLQIETVTTEALLAAWT